MHNRNREESLNLQLGNSFPCSFSADSNAGRRTIGADAIVATEDHASTSCSTLMMLKYSVHNVFHKAPQQHDERSPCTPYGMNMLSTVVAACSHTKLSEVLHS